MTEHPNAKLIRNLFAAFHDQDIAAIQNVISNDTVWHFPGRDGQLSGATRVTQEFSNFWPGCLS